MTPEPVGAMIIVTNPKTGKILLGKRKNSYKAGMFGFPGGRADRTETLIDASQRELFEETGLTAESLEYVGVVRENQKTYTFIHFVFRCASYLGNPVNKEPDKCAGWDWYQPDLLPEPMLPGHAAGLKLMRLSLPYADLGDTG